MCRPPIVLGITEMREPPLHAKFDALEPFYL